MSHYDKKPNWNERIRSIPMSAYRREHASAHLIRAEAWAEMMSAGVKFGHRVKASFARGFSRLERGLLKLDSLIRRLGAAEGEPCR